MNHAVEPVSALKWGRDWCDVHSQHVDLDETLAVNARSIKSDFSVGQGCMYVCDYRSVFNQLLFVRDRLAHLWGLGCDADDLSVAVVSTHRSRSITLPVFRLTVPNVGVFYLRDNFHDWKVSCELEVPVPSDTWGDLFDPQNRRSISGVFCEGFDPQWVHSPFAKNQQTFTVELWAANEHLFAFMWALRLQMIRFGRVAPRQQ